MAPPLAGKPPFATDHPDSLFADQPKPTPRPRKQNVDPTKQGGPRESAYTAFDAYFTNGNGTDPRASGVGDIGRGLMNAGSDYDDSSDDEPPQAPRPSDKHRALLAAATGAPPDPPPPSYERGAFVPAPEKQRSPPSQQSSNVHPNLPQAVHARANDRHTTQRPERSTPPAAFSPAHPMAQQRQVPPLSLQTAVAAPAPSHPRPPQAAFMQGQQPGIPHRGDSSPYLVGASSPGTRTPQPLPPPMSPIMPVFARPRKEPSAVKFDEKGEILRGNSEETLLPRGTGGKGDDFWRRFSMVAKEEARGGSKKSAWLRKTESGTTRMSTWVWFVGIMILIAIGGGIGVGWYFTHNKPAEQPVAIGGSANQGFTTTSSTSSIATVSTKPTKVTAAPVPTNTSNNNRRELDTLFPTNTPVVVPSAHRRSVVSRLPH